MKIDNFKVEDWFNEYEKLSKFDMADTCVESLSIDELLELIGNKEEHLKKMCSLKLNYGDIQGSDKLKQAISTMYKNVDIDNITITHGAIGANHLVFHSIVEPNDEIVSIIPTYQQHYSIPKSIGANVKLLFLKEENDWLPDIDDLKELVTPNTKMICMNNPNNPTGSVMPVELLKQIVELAKTNDCYILCDEVYRGLEHNGNISKSIVDLYDKGISTGSMSKVFSLAGLRLGWIVAPDEIMSKIIVHREYNTISISRIDDYFAAIAIENKDKIINRNLPKILEGKRILKNWIESEQHIEWIEPQGGTTALIKYDINMTSVELCKKLLDDTGVLFLPASTLEMDGYLRIGYCSDIKTLLEGLEIFSDWLKNN